MILTLLMLILFLLFILGLLITISGEMYTVMKKKWKETVAKHVLFFRIVKLYKFHYVQKNARSFKMLFFLVQRK